MSLDDYLHRFNKQLRVTVVGPTLNVPLCPTEIEQPIIWVDGGAHHRPPIAAKKRIGFSVGDGDSFDGELDQYLDTDKDYSDLAFVLSRLPEHFSEVVLLGFLGARQDHELFNLGEVHHFLTTAKSPTRVNFESKLTAYSAAEWTFNAHGVFSLAVFAPATVQLVGACKYPITAPTRIAPLRSLGLSNQGFGEITLTTDSPAFVFQPHYNQTRE